MKKNFELEHLPYIAALFQAVQFARAGNIYFSLVRLGDRRSGRDLGKLGSGFRGKPYQ